jgi:alpha-beta hydrolase superfamily lysophospholipase
MEAEALQNFQQGTDCGYGSHRLEELFMEHREGVFQGYEGENLYYQRWFPDGQSRGILVLIHGLGGHSGLFKNGVRCLLPQGYGAYAMDLRGHGQSPGQRGYIQHWSTFREDLRAFLAFIRTQEKSQPLFLWGHSLGGTISLDYALHYPEDLQGLILSAPALGHVGVPTWKLTLGQGLSWFWPQFRLKLGIDHTASSRDLAVRQTYATDPLRHEYGSARLAAEFFRTIRWIHHEADGLQVPLLLLQGGEDRVTLPESSQAFFQKLQLEDKQYINYPGSYHDLYADLNYMEVIADIAAWLSEHSATPQPISLPLQCLVLS